MSSPGPEKGQGIKYNRAEIAKVALDAYRQGQSMAVVVAGHFGIKLTNARKLISRMRSDGWDIPSQRGFNNDATGTDMSHRSPCGTPGAYKRHEKAGQEPCQVCKDDKARRARMRRAGVSTARPEAEWDGVVTTYIVNVRLMCDSCGDYVDTVAKLTHHTLQVHGRAPSREERTPR
jgi:hypothetical protein